MRELIHIGQTVISGSMVNTVNARDLHEKLGLEGDFSLDQTADQTCKIGGNRDYVTVVVKDGRGSIK